MYIKAIFQRNRRTCYGKSIFLREWQRGGGCLLENSLFPNLAVAYADEGVELRRAGIKTPIMVMNPDVVDFDRMLVYGLEPEIYSLYILQQLLRQKNGKCTCAYQTGNGNEQIGVCRRNYCRFSVDTATAPKLYCKKLLSHLAASEDPQLDTFTKRKLPNLKNYPAC